MQTASRRVAVLVHEDDDAGVVALRHQAAIDFGNGRFGIATIDMRVLVDRCRCCVLNTWSKKPRIFCRHFLRNLSRCATASC